MMDFSEKENERQRQYHSTYTHKPVPNMQLVAQHSRLNEEGRSSHAFQHPDRVEPAPAVPTTWDTMYDPEHPDADWTGLVSRTHTHKRHMHHHVSQQESIERTEYGIVSKEERAEWARKRATQDATKAKNSGSLVIGGIDAPEERWKTSYTRFENQEGTNRDQLTLEKRVNPIKRIGDPAQARSVRQMAGDPLSAQPSPRDYELYQQQQQQRQRDQQRSSIRIGAKTNLLSGLGEKIVSQGSVPLKDPAALSPRQPRPNENYRVLIGDNYNPFPGYTGYRR